VEIGTKKLSRVMIGRNKKSGPEIGSGAKFDDIVKRGRNEIQGGSRSSAPREKVVLVVEKAKTIRQLLEGGKKGAGTRKITSPGRKENHRLFKDEKKIRFGFEEGRGLSTFKSP